MAANQGFMQVCPNCPADYKIAGNITVAGGGGLANFSAPQTDVLMGVGSRVEYNAGGSIGYVASKVDQSNWYLVDATGVAMINQAISAIVSISAVFGSLATAEAGYAALTGNASLVATNQDVCFPCYANQTTYDVDAVLCNFDGPTCDATHEFFIYSITNLATEGNFVHANVNNGMWAGTKYRMQAMAGNYRIGLDNGAGFMLSVHITNLQIYHSWAGGRCIQMNAIATSRVFIEQCVLRLRDTGGPSLGEIVWVGTNNGQVVVMKNNVCFSTVHSTLLTGSVFYPFFTIRSGQFIVVGNTFHNMDDLVCTGSGMFVINNFLDLRLGISAGTYHDFNIYRQTDLEEEHGRLTRQTNEELFYSAAGFEDTWVWYPRADSELIGNGIKLRDEDSADLDHPEGYRLVVETHPVKDYEDGETFLPTDFLSPRGRWDVGALAYYPQDKIMYGICPNGPGNFRVGSECAVLDSIMYFVNAQNHNLMGIGARIQYNGAAVACVVGKLSENAWMVLTLTGAKPPDTNNTTCTLITHPFGSQSTFENGFSGNLGTSDLTQAEISMHGVCYCEQAGNTVDNVQVVYDGTTCDETYQLHVYTPLDTVRQCNFVHRVQTGGVWDPTLYRLEIATGNILTVGSSTRQYLNIMGLQLHMSSNALAARGTVYIFGHADGDTVIEQCVIRVADCNGVHLRQAVRVDNGSAKVYNCVIYVIGLFAIRLDFTGMFADGDGQTLDMKYCTMYGWHVPVGEGGAAVVSVYNSVFVRNAAVMGSITTQDYNVYDINEGEIHGYLTVQADAALFTAVAGGRETWDWTPALGSDLICRARHFNNHTPDLDHEAGFRSQGIAPDAGALERTQAVCPFGVCPNCPADFQTGAGLVRVLDGIATFEIPQVNVLMGVGADVDYGAGPAHGYVKEMINPFQFVLRTGAGGAPGNAADQAVNSIDHVFASQSAAEAGYAALTGNASLVAGDYQLWFPCYCEQATYVPDAVAVVYDGPTCDFGHGIKVWQTFSTVRESIMQHRVINSGSWDVTKYRLFVVAAVTIDLNDVANVISNIWFMGMQMFNTGAGGGARDVICLRSKTGSSLKVSMCIVRMAYEVASARMIINGRDNAGRVITVDNSIWGIEEKAPVGIGHYGMYTGVKDWVYIYNNHFRNWRRAIYGIAGATIWTKNNIYLWNDIANSVIDIEDYDLYRDVDQGEANGILTTQTQEELFSGFNAANPEGSNWSPAPRSNLIDNGMVSPTEQVDFAYMLQGDLDHPFETEWRGQSMPGTNEYDIGPLERKYAGLVQWYNYW